MSHIKLYACKLHEQIKICKLMFSSPKKFIQQVERDQKINIILLLIVLFLQLVCNFDDILNGKFVLITFALAISIFLFWVYMWCLIYLAKGEPRLHHVINASLYIHILYIFINLSKEMKAASAVVCCIGYILSIIILISYLKEIFRCEKERAKYIFYVDIGILVLMEVSILMNYMGNRIVYVKKLLYYYLLG